MPSPEEAERMRKEMEDQGIIPKGTSPDLQVSELFKKLKAKQQELKDLEGDK